MSSSFFRQGRGAPPWLLSLLAVLGVLVMPGMLGSASASGTSKTVPRARASLSRSVYGWLAATSNPQGCTMTPTPSPAQVGVNVDFGITFNYATNGQYVLDFGDGAVSPAISTGNGRAIQLKHAYASASTYVVKVVADPSLPLTMVPPPLCTVSVTVQAPRPTMTTNPSQVKIGEVVTATLGNLGTNLGNYSIDWGDGITDTVTSATMTHKYSASGGFPILLKQDGSLVVASSKVSVAAPQVTMTTSPSQVNIGEVVTATLGNLPVGMSYAYTIDWGDGKTSPVPGGSYTHTYAAPGVYPILLRDGMGQSGQPLATSRVSVLAPALALTVSPNPAQVGEQVTATPSGVLAGIPHEIDWGDGSTSPVTGNTPVKHAYRAPGTFVVTLSAPNNQYGIKPTTANVTVNAPGVSLSVAPNPALVGQQVTATPSGVVAGIGYQIDWGDGTTSPVTGNTPVNHTYSAPGTFVVTLSAPNTPSIKPATASLTVKLPTVTLAINPNPVLIGEQTTATPGNIVPGTAYTLDWGDGKTDTVTGNAPIKHAYTAPGLFVVALAAPGVAPVTVNVTVNAPGVSLTLAPNPALVGEAVTATPSGVVTGIAYELNWGDGNSSPVTGNTPVKHTYSAPGTFVVTLSAPNAPSIKPATASLTVKLPNAALSVAPNPALVGETVTATPSGTVQGVAYTLDWGDGTTAPVTTANPLRHGYSHPGVYVVKLSADGIKPMTATVTVRLPNPTLNVSPASVTLGEAVTATPGGIVQGAAYTLDWGDGTTAPVTGNTPLKHVYTAPGVYVVKLSSEGVAPATATVTVKAPNATLNVAPNPALVGETVTATPGSVVQGLTYTLDWGDGTTAPVTGNAPLKHAYTAPGVYVVKLSAEGLAPATVTVNVKAPVPTLTVSPNPALVGETVTATPGNIIKGLTYTLDWGDDKADSVTGNAPLKHTYAAPGVYVVKLSTEGAAPATVNLKVNLPRPTLDVQPNPARTGETVTATPGTLVRGVTYTLDWGDGSTAPITGPLKHTYAKAGVYVLQLTAEGVAAEGVAPVTVTLKVNESLDIQALRLHFVKPEDRPVMKVFQGSVLTAALDLEYAGQGHVLGELFLDGQSLARVDLLARTGATRVTFNIPNLPTDKLGEHRLEYRPDPVDGTAPRQSTPPVLIYTVDPAPTELEIAGFVFKITSLVNPDLNSFEGTATHTLIVGGVEAFKDQKVSFRNLKVQPVSAERVRVQGGGFRMDLSSFKRTPLPAGIDGFYLAPSFVNFAPTAASFTGTVALGTTCEPPDPASKNVIQAITLSGSLSMLNPRPMPPGSLSALNPQPIPPKVLITPAPSAGQKISSAQTLGSSNDFRFAGLQGGALISASQLELKASVLAEATKYCRPDPRYSYPLDAALKPDSGDLYGSAPAGLNSVKVPTTPFAMTGSSTMTLDLSVSQSAGSLGDILSAYALAPDAVKPPSGEAWMGVIFDQAQAALGNAKTAPLSASLRHGFTFSSELAAGSFTDRGWTFNMDKLGLAVVENAAVNSDGKATTRLPMFEENVGVNVSMQGAKLTYTLADAVDHNFGKSSLAAGAGVWVERGDALDLHLSGAAWNMKQLSTLDIPKTPPANQPKYPVSFSGGVLTLGGKASSPASGSGSASVASGLVGNVPAQAGGLSLASSLSSTVSASSAQIASAMLSGGASSSGGSSSGGSSSALPTPNVSGTLSAAQELAVVKAVEAALPLPSDARYEDGVVTLNAMIFTADGNVGFERRGASISASANPSPFTPETTADGLSKKTLGIPDFRMLGQTFNVTTVVLGRQSNQYVLGFDGQQKLNDKNPSIGVTVRYRVAAGKDRELALHTDGFENRVDPNALFRTEPSDTVLNLTTLGYVPVSDVRARLGANETIKAGLKQVEGGFELTLNGGLDTGKGAKTIAVKAEAVFGLVIPDPYFYVKASVENRNAPIVTLGTFNLYSFMGGIAYNMKWPDNASVPDYAKPPTRVKTGVIQIIGGAVVAVSDGSQLHMNGIFKIDLQRGFELTVDGWILTEMGQGVFGSTKPQARLLISVTGQGFYMEGCVGPQNKGAGDRIDCTSGQISQLKIVDMLTLTGHLWVNIGDGGNYVKIGTYSRPTEAKLDWPVVDNAHATAYLIIGEANDPGDRKGGITGQAGFFTGTMAEITYKGRWDGSAGPCSAWASLDAGLHTEFDAAVVFSPFSFDASIGMHAWVHIGAGGACKVWGVGPSISTHADLDAEINGHLWGLSPIGFEGSAKVRVDIPVVPTFTVGVHVKL